MGAVLDLLFNLVCERGLHATGARLLCLARRPHVTLDEQMQHVLPDLLAGALLWAAAILAASRIWH